MVNTEQYFKKKRDFTQSFGFRKFRDNIDIDFSLLRDRSLSMRSALFLKQMCEKQIPIVLEDDVIAFARSDNNKIPPYITQDEIISLFGNDGVSHDILNNCCPNYSLILKNGLEYSLNKIQQKKIAKNKDAEFLEAAEISINAVLELADRYKEEARIIGLKDVASNFNRVPRYGATSFVEALQSLRFVSAMFYLAGNFQIGFGRMDQYLYPYYINDINSGKIDKIKAKNLLKEFFISLNRDIDLYPGVTVGDNGQSVVLGGVKVDGSSAINDLTYLIIEASKELSLIDPKINLRIDKNTPDKLLLLACELTKIGLGFPQYLNDEVIIPGLISAGYSLEDARDYAVAACWEFLIPGKGLDIVNQGAVSFPYAVDFAQRRLTEETFTLHHFHKYIKESITDQVRGVIYKHNVKFLPAPFISVFFDNCIDTGKDITECAKYNNIGIHGAASASAADAYVIVEHYINSNNFNEFNRVRVAAANNFLNNENLVRYLVNFPDKTGNDTQKSNHALTTLFDIFSTVCQNYSTPKRSIRPGSGSAQFYVWLTKTEKKFDFLVEPRVAATIEGRRDGMPFSSSLAPANEIKTSGILSVLRTFSNLNYNKIVNGGPITVEFTPNVFESKENMEKMVSLLRYFVILGNQELQLNVLNVQTLEDALKNPEKHRNLIVRVWGWSGYFCELPREFQEQIISRHKYSL